MATGNAERQREVLQELSEALRHRPRLHALVEEAIGLSYRDSYKRGKARARRRGLGTLTDDEQRTIARYSLANPHVANRDVGDHVGIPIDGGRVSEILEAVRRGRLKL